MYFADVDIPTEVIEAQQDGRLVLFVGAGASVSAPSNYPLFNELAKSVASGTIEISTAEPIEEYMTRVEDSGVNIQKRTREILTDPASRPNAMHHALVTLFGRAEHVRIVTTNFDSHFSEVAKEVFEDLPEYVGPALPLGRGFRGLVYLHGKATSDGRLVLTSRDFAEAYLTDGWATRFLRQLFGTYVVLFVGYSHSDPLVRYLSQGIYDSQGLFTLTNDQDLEKWRMLRIAPVTYAEHVDALESLERWGALASLGLLEHEERTRELVQGEGTLSPDENDYLLWVFTSADKIRLFTRHARSNRWLQWAKSNGRVDPIFRDSYYEDSIVKEIADWFCECFVPEEGSGAMTLIWERGGRINPELWYRISHSLFRHRSRMSSSLLLKWITLLVRQGSSVSQGHSLSLLLSDLEYEHDRQSILLLFAFLASPCVVLQPTFPMSVDLEQSREVDVDVVLRTDKRALEDCWNEKIKPNLPNCHRELLPLLVGMLSSHHQIYVAFGSGDFSSDRANLRRSSIAPHEQDDLRHDEDLLIDACRDVMEFCVLNNSRSAETICNELLHFDAPLIRRIAVHTFGQLQHLSPDAKLDWITQNKLLYEYPYRQEVFSILESVFGGAGDDGRGKFVEFALAGPAVEGSGNEVVERDYEIWNVFVWLRRVAPDDEKVETAHKMLSSKHPDFGERPYPGLYRWMGTDGEEAEVPYSVEELLALTAEHHLRSVRRALDAKTTRHDERDALGINSSSVSERVSRGLELLRLLLRQEEINCELWDSVIAGLRKGAVKPDEWSELLNLLRSNASRMPSYGEVSRLLFEGISKDQNPIPKELVVVSDELSIAMFEVLEHVDDATNENPELDWLTEAINEPGGVLAEYWLHSLSKIYSATKDGRWRGIPENFREVFSRVIRGESHAAQLARCLLGSHVHFLFALDETWTTSELLPIFDWSTDSLAAQQVWDGFLAWGRLNNDKLVAAMLPYYRSQFDHIDDHVTERSAEILHHMAFIAIYGPMNPLDDSWLKDLLRSIGPELRKRWAIELKTFLRRLGDKAKQEVWNAWLESYWRLRSDGIPVPLEDDELSIMVEWPLVLEPVFPEIVKLLPSESFQFREDSMLVYELNKSSLTDRFPEDACRLLLVALRASRQPFYNETYAVELTQKLIGHRANRDCLLSVCEELGRLGVAKALELKARIDDSS